MRINLNKYLLFCVWVFVFAAQNSLASSLEFEKITSAVIFLKRNAPALRKHAEYMNRGSDKDILLINDVAYPASMCGYDYIRVRFEDGVVAELIKERSNQLLPKWYYKQNGFGRGEAETYKVVDYVGIQDFDWKL